MVSEMGLLSVSKSTSILKSELRNEADDHTSHSMGLGQNRTHPLGVTPKKGIEGAEKHLTPKPPR